MPPEGPPPPEGTPDPFDQRRDKIHARIGVARKLGEGVFDQEVIELLDVLSDNVQHASDTAEGVGILTQAEDILEQLEDALDGM